MENTHVIYQAFNKSPPSVATARKTVFFPPVDFHTITRGLATTRNVFKQKMPQVNEDVVIQKAKLAKIGEYCDTCLLRITTVFPFDFFPDEITIDPEKVNIVSREFFFSEDVHSILVTNIKDISIETNIFFATLKIVPDVYVGHPVDIPFLWKKDAIHARRIIQGLIVSKKEGIDPTQLIKKAHLTHELERIGALEGIEKNLSPLLPG